MTLPEEIVREARAEDAEALAPMFADLGYPADAQTIAGRITALGEAGVPLLVMERGGAVAGCCTLAIIPVLHRPAPVGRIMLMVIDRGLRGQGIGARLLAAAEAELRRRGCGVIEVTSGIARTGAHRFYEREGYLNSAHRFAKKPPGER